MKYLLGIVFILVVCLVALYIYVNSGSYNISALEPHNSVTLWMIDDLTTKSIENHAKDITAPDLSAKAMIRAGFIHYRQMCVECHGAPGKSLSEIAKGLYPKPPSLTDAVKDWKPSEVFWITKNGIKMTGMPAFGKTHSDEKIWDIVSFLEKLPNITKEQYDNLDKSIPFENE